MTENDILFKVWFFIALVTIGSRAHAHYQLTEPHKQLPLQAE
ncbi:hypothetical protein MCO_00279 [Bartonella sp. DB5-6]|nr:hypothetical protein [Bartonella sp. DB5-6]EJF80283.1 hypothetical protein MCO_00279 [Bartonella sp. DB5-6]